MFIPSHEYLWIFEYLLKAIEYAAKGTARYKARASENAKNRILDHLNQKTEPSSSGIVWADVFIRPIIQDVPFDVAFPPSLRGWKRFRLELRRFPYEARHRWRVWRRLPSKEAVERWLKELLREHRVRCDPYTKRYSAVR